MVLRPYLLSKTIYELDNFKSEFLQATTVEIEDWSDSVVVSSVYYPPKHIIVSE
jgi:hypothetical protein